MPELLLIGIYLCFFLTLIWKWHFFHLPELGRLPLMAIFVLKAAFAIFYGVLYQSYYEYGDTINFFDSGLLVYYQLFTAPADFFFMVFGAGAGQPPQHLEQLAFEVDYWGNKSSYFMVRVNALLSIFSLGVYNVHAVIMAFLSLIGLTAIYKLLVQRFPEKSFAFALVIFLVPSILLYGSALHKEAILIFFLGLLIYNFKKLLDGYWQLKYIVSVVFSIFMIFMVKDFILAGLVPCLTAYAWYKYRPGRPFIKFSLIFILFWIVVFNADLLFPSFELERILAAKQTQFMELQGQSDIHSAALEPSWISWLQYLPAAIINTTIRPFPGEIETIYQGMYWIEIVLVILATLMALLFLDKRMLQSSSLVYFALFFFLTVIIIIGLVVNNLGAISRYKTPALLFYLCFLVIITDRARIFYFYKRYFRRT